MPGTIARASGALSRKIARPLWIVGAALTMCAPVALAATGPATDSVAVSAPATTKSLRVAPSRAGSAETLIADFRYGAPRMGSTPRLPIPPPHRMRSGSAHPRS